MPYRINCLERRGCLTWCILIKWWGYPALQNSCCLTQKSCLTRWVCLKDESASKIRLPNMNELCQTFRLPHKMKLLNQTRMHRSKMRLSHSTRIYSNISNAFWLFHSYARHSIFTLVLWTHNVPVTSRTSCKYISWSGEKASMDEQYHLASAQAENCHWTHVSPYLWVGLAGSAILTNSWNSGLVLNTHFEEP